MSKREDPCTIFGTTQETFDAALEIAVLIDAELVAQNIAIVAEVPEVSLANVTLTIVPPTPTVTARVAELLEVMYQDCGWFSLSYTPGTGIAILELPTGFPTNERTLTLCVDTLPSCKCRY